MPNTQNVATGKPKVGGAVFRAPLGTVLPTNATEALADAFEELGYISDAGVKSSNTRESEEKKAWGGTTVMTSQTEYGDNWQAVFIEVLRIAVLKMVFGDKNVTGTLETGITVKANAAQLPAAIYVFDMLLNGAIKRVVLPNANISAIGDTVYTDNDLAGYDTTLSALPDTDENTHYEYIQAAQAPAPGTFTVTQNLTNVTSDFSGATVGEGAALDVTLTPDNGMTIGTVTVTMGGTDISATAWDSGTSKVTIANVTGNVEIEASAS